ncbi:MAG: HD domain-containing protein [Chloroflexi bacterium]|nr:HD domain-containing protein [Chloroflexota bacterium]
MKILTRVARFLREQKAEAFLVGGFIRDQLLRRAIGNDLDLAIRGDAIALARAFADAQGGAFYLMDASRGVARVLFEDQYVDFADLRGDVRADLAARDFTINAMARRVDQLSSDADQIAAQLRDARDLIDPFDGASDLRARKIRAVSADVFKHDPVRLLRAIRLAGELDFTIESGTETQMEHDAGLLAVAVMERARDEWMRILNLPSLTSVLHRIDQMKMLGALFPEVIALKGVTQSPPHEFDVFEHTLHVVSELVSLQAGSYTSVANGEFVWQLNLHFSEKISASQTRGALLRLSALLHDVGKPATRTIGDAGQIHFYAHDTRGAEIVETILRRMKFSNAEIEIVTQTVRHHLRPLLLSENAFTNRAAYRFFRAAEGVGIDVCALSLADQRGKRSVIDPVADAEIRATLSQLLDRYYRAQDAVIAPPQLVNGRELMEELKLAAGPQIGKLLEVIREAQAAGEVKSRADALALARKTLAVLE